MIILKGDKGKGRIVEKIYQNSEDDEILIISVGEPVLKYADYTTENLEVLNDLREFIENARDCKYIIIYTNYPEDVVKHYKQVIEELEYQYGTMCILTCKN